MQGLHQLEIVIVLLVAVLALVTIARRILIPYPIFLVLGGLGLGVVPNVPIVRLDPDLVFLIFLPPILWAAAYFTSLRDFRANLRPITLLAVGLVLATTIAVAAVARVLIPGMSWPVALALGAIVSPPDAVAATAIARRLGIPYRIVTVLEGESLINDAAALVLYRTAVAAAGTGALVATQALWQFALASAGGVLIGLIVGMGASRALRLTDDSLAQTAITLLAPYAAWVIAERAHTSAVLACVVGGLYVRQGFSALVAPATRIQSRAVWDLLVFLLNGVIFILIGLQLGAIRETGLPGNLGTIMWRGALISAAAIGVRLVWVPLAVGIPRLVRALNLDEDRTRELEEARAREEAAQAVLARLDQLATASWPLPADVDRLRAIYTQKVRRASPLDVGDSEAAARAQAAFRRLRQATLIEERRTLIALRDQGAISDEILHRLEQELDVEAMRIGLGEARLDD